MFILFIQSADVVTKIHMRSAFDILMSGEKRLPPKKNTEMYVVKRKKKKKACCEHRFKMENEV